MQIKKSELNSEELVLFASLFKSNYLQFKGKSPLQRNSVTFSKVKKTAKFDHKNQGPIFYLNEKRAEYASSSSSTKCFSSTECKKFRTHLFFSSFTTLVWWGEGDIIELSSPTQGEG